MLKKIKNLIARKQRVTPRPTAKVKDQDWLGRRPRAGRDWLGRNQKSRRDWLGRT